MNTKEVLAAAALVASRVIGEPDGRCRTAAFADTMEQIEKARNVVFTDVP
jgi:hypothetical protein